MSQPENNPLNSAESVAESATESPASTPEITADGCATASGTDNDSSAPNPADLAVQLEAANQKAAEHYDAFLRAKAEGENIRRRAQEDIAKAHKFAVEKFAGELLAVKDSLEAALAVPEQTVDSFKSGVELTL